MRVKRFGLINFQQNRSLVELWFEKESQGYFQDLKFEEFFSGG